MRNPTPRLAQWLLAAALAAGAAVAVSPALAESGPHRGAAPSAGVPTFQGDVPTLTLPTPPAGPVTPAVGATQDAAQAAPAPTPNRSETLGSCLGDWDPGTHMSKAEWLASCERTVNGTDLPYSDGAQPATRRGSRGGMGH